MKKTVLALTFILTLFSAASCTQIISLAEAKPNMFIKPRYCHILIQSPQSGTPNSAQILLNFTVKKWDISDVYSYFYILDGQDIQSGVKIEEIQFVGEETLSEEHLFSYVETTLRGQAVLPSLSDGAHSVTVFIGQVRGDGMIQPANVDPFSATTNFNVDSTIQSPCPAPQETVSAPLPTTLVATASGVSAALACLGLLVYVKKRNGGKNLRREQP
jgi:hypothetical protein